MIDLDTELELALRRFERMGCSMPGELCLHIPALGLQYIEPGDDFYEPVEYRHAPLAVIIPVYNGPMPSFTRPVDEIPELIDLVAFRMSNPRRWWRRTGLADYLGEHLIQAAVTWQKPLRVLETPFAWLNAHGAGVCPLGNDYSALRDPLELRFDAPAFAARIKRQLVRPFPIPRILVRNLAA